MDLDESSMHTPSALETIGKEDLSDASLHELAERVVTLKAEIVRVEGVIDSKKQSHQAAEGFFKS